MGSDRHLRRIYPPRPAQQTTPAQQAAVGEEDVGQVRQVTALDLDPVVQKVSSLLADGHALEAGNSDSALLALEDQARAVDGQPAHVAEGEQVAFSPGVLAGQIPDRIEDLSGHG